MSSVTWPVRTQELKGKRPVAPPRTSPRQHKEESSAANMTSPRPVARARPALSPRDGKLKLFERDSDVDGYVVEQTKNLERDAETFGYKKDRDVEQKPMVPVRRKTIEETRDEGTGRVARVCEYERTTSVSVEKPMAPSRRKETIEETSERRKDDEFYENERGKSLSEKPMAPSRTKKTIEETHERRKHDEFYENERGKSLSGKPMAPSRSKKTVDREETHEKLREKDDGTYDYKRTKSPSEKPMASPRNEKTVKEMHEKRKGRDRGVDEYERTRSLSEKPMAPSRRKKTLGETYEESREKVDTGYEYDKTAFRRKKSLEETHEVHSRAQIPVITTSAFEDDGPFLDRGRAEMEEYGNLRRGQRPVSSVTRRTDSTEESEDEDDSGRVLYRKRSFGSKDYDQEEMDGDRRVADGREKSVSTPPRPSPRGRSMVDDILKAHSKVTQPEEVVKPAKRPGSAPSMKKASSLETLSPKQGSLSKKVPSGSSEHGTQRVQLKKSLTPQRPMSGKKGSLLTQLRQKAQADATDTFEEHVPTVENVIGTAADDRGFKKKGAWDTGNI